MNRIYTIYPVNLANRPSSKQPGNQLLQPVDIDWFCDVGIEPRSLRVGPEVMFLVRGDRDDRDVLEFLILADELGGGETIHEREREVHLIVIPVPDASLHPDGTRTCREGVSQYTSPLWRLLSCASPWP